MNQWHQIVMSGDDIAAGRHIRMRREFDDLLVSMGGGAKGVHLYLASTGGNDVYYLPPSASVAWAAFAAKYGGGPCQEPDTGNLKPVVLRE